MEHHSDHVHDHAAPMAPRYFGLIQLAVVGVLAVLGLFLLMLTLNEVIDFGRGNLPYSNSITVNGKGEATIIPDIAKIQFSVTESGASVTEAQSAATEKTNAALAALKDQNIEEKDLKTLNYTVSPKYEYPQNPTGAYQPTTPKIVGYEVSQSVQVTVRDTAKAGEVLEKLGSLGVQNISGPNFVTEETDAATTEARAEAIKDAEAKAKVLAKQLGVSLGKVMSYSEGGMYPYSEGYGGDMGMSFKAASAPSLPVGENTKSVEVMVTYEIK